MLTKMKLWEWCSPFETTKNLTRPEVAQYVIQMTKDLADLLDITLGEVIHHQGVTVFGALLRGKNATRRTKSEREEVFIEQMR
jgi:hypothetical protein